MAEPETEASAEVVAQPVEESNEEAAAAGADATPNDGGDDGSDAGGGAELVAEPQVGGGAAGGGIVEIPAAETATEAAGESGGGQPEPDAEPEPEPIAEMQAEPEPIAAGGGSESIKDGHHEGADEPPPQKDDQDGEPKPEPQPAPVPEPEPEVAEPPAPEPEPAPEAAEAQPAAEPAASSVTEPAGSTDATEDVEELGATDGDHGATPDAAEAQPAAEPAASPVVEPAGSTGATEDAEELDAPAPVPAVGEPVPPTLSAGSIGDNDDGALGESNVEPELELEPESELDLPQSASSSATGAAAATATAGSEAAPLDGGLVVPEASRVFTEESGEVSAGAEGERDSQPGSRPVTSQSVRSARSRLDTPQRTEVLNQVLEPALDGLWPLEPPQKLALCIIVRPISVRQELVCLSTMSWYGVKEMLSEALGVSPLDMTIVCHGEPRADDVTLLEDGIQSETRLEMLIATPDPKTVAKESSAQLLHSMYSDSSFSGGRRTCQIRQRQWKHPPRPPVKPPAPPYKLLAVPPTSFQPTPPMAETIELVTQVDNFSATRLAQQHSVNAAWNAVVAMADSDGAEAGFKTADLRHVSAAVGDPGRNPYATLPWNEVVLPSWGDGMPFGLQHDPYGWVASRKKLHSRGSLGGGMAKGNLASDVAQATTPEEDAMVDALRPPDWTQPWPLNEGNRLLIAKLNVRADSHARRGGHVGREASCRNGAVAIGRCPTKVTSGEQAALELRLQVVGQWLGDEIDEVLSDCKVIEANVSKTRRDALLDARRQTVNLPKVQSGIRAHHPDGDNGNSDRDVMSNVYAKRGRIIKMPGMKPPPHSLCISPSARRAGEKTPGAVKLTSATRALVDKREHLSASDTWRQTARQETAESDMPWINSQRGVMGSMRLQMVDAKQDMPAVAQNRSLPRTPRTPRTPRLFPQESYRTSKALAEGRVVEDEKYVKLRLSARRQREQEQKELIERRFRDPDGTVQVWLRAKNTEVPYKDKQVTQARQDMRRLNSDRLERKTRREKEAKSLLKEINFLIERSGQNLLNAKFSQQRLDEQRMKEKKIVEFEGRLKRGEISLHLMGALRNVHRMLVMDLFNEVDSDEGGTLDRDEVRDLARSLGNQLTEAQLDQAMAEMDEDGSGEVDFAEFFDWWCKALNQKDDGGGNGKGAISINTKGAESEGYEVVPFGK